MADILIRGMEMPKHCIDCPCMVDKYGSDNCCLQSEEANEKITSWDDMKAGCPLQELPEHGDLKDARQILEEIDDIWDGRPLAPIGAKVLAIIDSSPVIVPADKEETE